MDEVLERQFYFAMRLEVDISGAKSSKSAKAILDKALDDKPSRWERALARRMGLKTNRSRGKLRQELYQPKNRARLYKAMRQAAEKKRFAQAITERYYCLHPGKRVLLWANKEPMIVRCLIPPNRVTFSGNSTTYDCSVIQCLLP